jgi:hypothetical protein
MLTRTKLVSVCRFSSDSRHDPDLEIKKVIMPTFMPLKPRKLITDHSLFFDEPLFLRKSRDEISWRGEGCNTPGVTVATTVHLQYLCNNCYSRILVQRVPSSNLNSFWIILFKPLFASCKGTSKFWIQVSQSKLTVLKIMPRKNFGWIYGTYPKGFELLKNSSKFQIGIFPRFYNSQSIWNLNSF